MGLTADRLSADSGFTFADLLAPYEAARARQTTATAAVPPPRRSEQPYAAGSAIVVEHDTARLDYDGEFYRLTMRRLLRNTGDAPITRYLIRISVDRYPGDPERSNAHYRVHPLTWDELALTATCRGEAMRWEAKHDRDAFKEVWLLFDNEQGRFPLYPCDSVWIEYAYTVSDTKWGRWFQRAVRLPTEHLEVVLAFPAALDPVVWGTETSMTAEASPLPSAPGRRQQGLTEARLLLPSRRWRMKFRGRLLIRRAKLIASKGCSSARPEQRTPNPRVAGSNPVTPAGLAMPLPSPHSPPGGRPRSTGPTAP